MTLAGVETMLAALRSTSISKAQVRNEVGWQRGTVAQIQMCDRLSVGGRMMEGRDGSLGVVEVRRAIASLGGS